MDEFLDSYDMPKLNQDEINISTTSKMTEAEIVSQLRNFRELIQSLLT